MQYGDNMFCHYCGISWLCGLQERLTALFQNVPIIVEHQMAEYCRKGCWAQNVGRDSAGSERPTSE